MAEVGHEICEVFRRHGGAGDGAGDRRRGRATSWTWCCAAIPDGITVLDADGRIIYANDAAARIAGFASAAEMLHAPGDDIAQRFQMWDETGQRLLPEDCPAAGRCAASATSGCSATGPASDGQLDGWVSLEAVPITAIAAVSGASSTSPTT